MKTDIGRPQRCYSFSSSTITITFAARRSDRCPVDDPACDRHYLLGEAPSPKLGKIRLKINQKV
jgi:hypothetical protein